MNRLIIKKLIINSKLYSITAVEIYEGLGIRNNTTFLLKVNAL